MGSTISDRMIRSLLERSVAGEASSVKSTFSSWDNCMAKTYCKWPVIAGIIVGSIIVLGIVGCLVSCLCCGYQCCKGCCGCCYSCCGCGGSRHDRGPQYADPPQRQPYYQQPPPPEPMNFGYRQPIAAASSLSAGPPPAYRGPTTASFEQPSKAAHVHVNEDELPPMPTWAEAQTRRVEDHHVEHEEVEMDNLQGIRDHAKSPPHQNQRASPAPVAGGLSRGMSRGGYDQVPGTYPSPHPSPQPMYDEGYSPNGHAPNGHGGGYGGHPGDAVGGSLGGHDAYLNHSDQGHYGGSQADTHYFNQSPHSPGPQSPGYDQPAVAGYGPRASPAPYRGFENQSPPRVQVLTSADRADTIRLHRLDRHPPWQADSHHMTSNSTNHQAIPKHAAHHLPQTDTLHTIINNPTTTIQQLKAHRHNNTAIKLLKASIEHSHHELRHRLPSISIMRPIYS
uniref:[PSI+] induction protein 2 n=1 Tax=Talaromyces marneffei PM1 TaxID=1077442 RepID=A0A093X7R0_TALMA